MKIIFKIVILLFVVSSISCVEGEDTTAARFKILYTGEFLENERNIQKLLGANLSIENIESKEVSNYKIEYSIGTELNHLLSEDGKDTLDSFYAYRKKKMWFLVRPKNEEFYTIQGIKKDKDKLVGWKSNSAKNAKYQMNELQHWQEETNIQFLSVEGRPYHYIADQNKIIELYSAVLDTLTPEVRIIKEDSGFLRGLGGKRDKSKKEDVKNMDLESDYIQDLYPFPANQEFTLVVFAEGKYDLEIMNTKGDFLFKTQFSGKELTVDLAKIPSGTHVLVLKDPRGNLLDIQKLIVEK